MSRHLDAAVELQKASRRVLDLLSTGPAPERIAMIYLIDAVGQLIEHLKEEDQRLEVMPTPATTRVSLDAQGRTPWGEKVYEAFIEKEDQPMPHPTAEDREQWREEIAAAKKAFTKEEFADWLTRKLNSVGDQS